MRIHAPFVAAGLALCAAVAFPADLIGRRGDDWVRLTEKPCTNPEVIARLEPAAVEHFQAAAVMFQGQRFDACWLMLGNAAYLIYTDGDEGIVPANELKPGLDA